MTPTITGVAFQLLDPPSLRGEVVRLVVASEQPFSGAIAARVRVGDQEGRLGTFNLEDGSLNVYLSSEPAEGDVVRVGWHDGQPLEDTSFTYQRPPNA